MGELCKFLATKAAEAKLSVPKRDLAKVDPLSRTNEAIYAARDLMKLAQRLFRLASDSSGYRFAETQKLALEAVRRSLGRSGTLIVPLTLDLQTARNRTDELKKLLPVSPKGIDLFQMGKCPGQRFGDALRDRHSKDASRLLSKYFPGQNIQAELHRVMNDDLPGLEDTIKDPLNRTVWRQHWASLASPVWMSLEYLFSYALCGFAPGVAEMLPLVKLFGEDNSCLPVCNRETDPKMQHHWIILVGR